MSRTDTIEKFVTESPKPVTPTQVWSAVGFRPHGFLSHLVKMGRLHRLGDRQRWGEVGFNGAHEPRYWFRLDAPSAPWALVERSRVKTAIALFCDPKHPRVMPEWLYEPHVAIFILDYLDLEAVARIRFA